MGKERLITMFSGDYSGLVSFIDSIPDKAISNRHKNRIKESLGKSQSGKTIDLDSKTKLELCELYHDLRIHLRYQKTVNPPKGEIVITENVLQSVDACDLVVALAAHLGIEGISLE